MGRGKTLNKTIKDQCTDQGLVAEYDAIEPARKKLKNDKQLGKISSQDRNHKSFNIDTIDLMQVCRKTPEHSFHATLGRNAEKSLKSERGSHPNRVQETISET